MAVRLGAAPSEHGIFFAFGVTQQQFAEVTGLTAVHVNRTLNSMRHVGLVEISKRTVCIPDWNDLVRVSEFDPGYLQADRSLNARLRIVA